MYSIELICGTEHAPVERNNALLDPSPRRTAHGVPHLRLLVFIPIMTLMVTVPWAAQELPCRGHQLTAGSPIQTSDRVSLSPNVYPPLQLMVMLWLFFLPTLKEIVHLWRRLSIPSGRSRLGMRILYAGGAVGVELKEIKYS